MTGTCITGTLLYQGLIGFSTSVPSKGYIKKYPTVTTELGDELTVPKAAGTVGGTFPGERLNKVPVNNYLLQMNP